MELFLCYVIGITLVSFVSIILTEAPIPVLPQANRDLALNPTQAQPRVSETSKRIDLIGNAHSEENNHAVSDLGSLAELSASAAAMSA